MLIISIPDSLRNLCHRQGVSVPAQLPADDLARLLPSIVQSVGAELQRGRVEICKSASVIRAAVEFVPSPGIVRDERLPVGSDSPDSADPNSILDTVMPWG